MRKSNVNKTVLALLVLTILTQVGIAQEKTRQFQDSRDGKIYSLANINGVQWFGENLQYKTEGSYCLQRSKWDCSKGNFYPIEQIDTLCPEGTRRATINDWETAFRQFMDEQNIPDSMMIFEENKLGQYISYKGHKDSSKSFYAENTPLNIQGIGWVQGKRHKNIGTLTIWLDDTETKNNLYHAHIGKKSYVLHQHKHHIEDKKRKIRRFAIRCIVEEQID